jgi:hypothetical protein
VAVGPQVGGPVDVGVVEHLPVGSQGGGRVTLGLQHGRLQVQPRRPVRAPAVGSGRGIPVDGLNQEADLGRGQPGPQGGDRAVEAEGLCFQRQPRHGTTHR